MYRRIAAALVAWTILACTVPPSSPADSPDVAPTNRPTPAAPTATLPSETPQTSEEPAEARAGCGRVVANTAPRGRAARPLAVFASADGLFVYDIRNNAATLLEPPAAEPARAPRFRSASLVTYVRKRESADDRHIWGRDSLYEFDLERRQSQELLRLPSRLLAYQWSPDGTQLAYLVELGDQSNNHLCLLNTDSGTTGSVRSFSYSVGRGGHQWDETSIAWAPTARALLVVHTITEPPSVHVVDLDGRDLVPPQMGTFARWLADDAVLFLEGSPQATLQPWRWFVLSVTTGAKERYGLPDEGFRPALSPDGGTIAFDDGAEQPSIYVFDVDTGGIRRLARGYVAPVWLGPKVIGATAAGPCPPSNFCVIPWLPSGPTIGIESSTRDRTPLSLTTTLEASFDILQTT
jgi:hypothetical protein